MRDDDGDVICFVHIYTACLNAQQKEVRGIKICLGFPGPGERLYLCECPLASDIFRNNTNYPSNKCTSYCTSALRRLVTVHWP